ncbi:nucleotidyltransferase family protein [Pelistega suis]|uniref:nucleotidyltransferase family protein n=1 Tax=Pelistega suis TaxID=1631957 RepID=UPI00211CB115|nr:nucleotidyltransferase domain-containing protein [Pelistega suis]MCQ9328681.1 nucleotidyltransferase [Pelistega suis]
MKASEVLSKKRNLIKAVFQKYPEFTNPQIFGSVARGEDDNLSDIDFLTDAQPNIPLKRIDDLFFDLEKVLGDVNFDLAFLMGFKGKELEKVLQDAQPL